jgi:hypothetical protein
MIGKVTYGAADSVVSRMPSPAIWADCPSDEMLANPERGLYIWDDFLSGIVADATLVLGQRYPGWTAYVESDQAADVALQSDETGVIKLDQDGTDDDVTVVTSGDNVTGCIKINANDPRPVWYETRVKLNTVTDGDLATFVGLMQEGQAGDGTPLGALGALADVDYIGFVVNEDDGDAVDFVVHIAGTAAGGTANIATLTANTYVRLGFKYIPNEGKIRVFVDGEEVKDAVYDISSASFPAAQKLALVFAIASGANGVDSDGLYVDWVRLAQKEV